jgi:hypothetical protein
MKSKSVEYGEVLFTLDISKWTDLMWEKILKILKKA